MSKRVNIKTKIFGLIIIIIIALLINAVWSIYNFSRLEDSINDIMQANYQSIVAAQNMSVAIERQDSAELAYMFEPSEEIIGDFRLNEQEFLKWLSRAEDNITEVGENKILEDINNYSGMFLGRLEFFVIFFAVIKIVRDIYSAIKLKLKGHN